MTIPNFDGIPGVTYKKFCSFCSEEATGDLQVPVNDEETFPVPVCEACAKKALDNGIESMVN